jgi:hypothetical protein
MTQKNMTQKDLDSIDGYIKETYTHYYSGLITLVEFKNAIDRIGVIGDVSGLIDPTSGLRYP